MATHSRNYTHAMYVCINKFTRFFRSNVPTFRLQYAIDEPIVVEGEVRAKASVSPFRPGRTNDGCDASEAGGACERCLGGNDMPVNVGDPFSKGDQSLIITRSKCCPTGR